MSGEPARFLEDLETETLWSIVAAEWRRRALMEEATPPAMAVVIDPLDLFFEEQRNRVARTLVRFDMRWEAHVKALRALEDIGKGVEWSTDRWLISTWGSGHGRPSGYRRLEDKPVTPGHPDWW